MKLDDFRREYLQSGLSREQLAANPITQFETWLKQAIEAKINDPTAMVVATVDQSGQPSQRIVLLKDVSPEGFVFYTNLESHKAKDLAQNPKISLHFPWHALERQVKICGEVEQLSRATVMKYFLSRPKESQLAAWASQQSERISSKQALMGKFNEIKQRFADGNITLPDFWGGYLVKPSAIEFWQGGAHRLHDRFMYTRQEDNSWDISQLQP